MNPKPRQWTTSVSVCIPAFRGRFLAATIESILDQTRPADEIIVVDDHSPDNLWPIVARYSELGVRYVRNSSNLGVPGNYTQALSLAQCDYVMLFGDHDLMLPHFVERSAELLDTDPDVAFVFALCDAVDETVQVIQRYPRSLFPPIFEGRRLARWLVTHTASPVNLNTLIRRSALERVEPWFDPKYWWYGDIHLWIRLASQHKVGYVTELLSHRRVREARHYLDDKLWQSELICDRIRRDSWSLAFPDGGAESWWWRMVYAIRRDIAWGRLILSLRARHDRAKAEALPDQARAEFSSLSSGVAGVLAALPPTLIRGIRRVKHRR